MRLLLARARNQGAELAVQLALKGFEVWHYEAVDFEYLGDEESQEVYANVVFPSATAVQFFGRFCQNNGVELTGKSAFCVGPATQKAASGLPFSQVFGVKNPPYDSDALYALMKQTRILDSISIVTSIGGRRVVQQWLDSEQKKYNELRLYRRVIGQLPVKSLINFAPETIIASSYDVWRGAKAALGNKLESVCLVIVPSERVRTLVRAEVNSKVRVVQRLNVDEIAKEIL